MPENFIYIYKGKEYPVVINRKKIKNIIFRFKDGRFVISAPTYALQKSIVKGLNKYGPIMIKKDEAKPKNEDDNFIYLLGAKIEIFQSGIIRFSDDSEIKYNSKQDLDDKLKKFFLNFITNRVRFYEHRMNLSPYKVRVKNMTSRYGSNSRRSKSLSFATLLMHYTVDVIDSVVVHELAHEYYFDHSKNFYNIVYKYFPSYDEAHYKLRKGIYHD